MHQEYPVSRSEALAKNAPYYLSGKPCKRGHNTLRSAVKGYCIDCNRNHSRGWREVNPERFKELRVNWRQKNLDRDKENKKRWRDVAIEAGTYASLKKRNYRAMPAWADKNAIASIYRAAKSLTKLTGIAYHVDHVIPLCGYNVCGLHVETNLEVITQSANQAKHRKL